MSIHDVTLALVVAVSMQPQPEMTAAAMRAANQQTAQATRQIAASTLADIKARPTEGGRLNPLSLPAETANQARLLAGIPVYLLRLDKLVAFTPGSDPLSLLSTPTKMVYPVRLGNATSSMIDVSQKPDENAWIVSALGRAAFVRSLADVMPQAVSGAENPARITVWVPALNQRFAGELEGSSLTLIPLVDDSTLGFRKGQRLTASEVFTKLRPAALKIDPSVPR